VSSSSSSSIYTLVPSIVRKLSPASPKTGGISNIVPINPATTIKPSAGLSFTSLSL
jgi:hypothetical protein